MEPSGHGLPRIKCFSPLSNRVPCLLIFCFVPSSRNKVMHLHTLPHLTLQMSIFHALLKYFIAFLSLMFFWSVHPFLSPSLHFLIIDLVSSALLGYPAVCSLSMAQWDSAQAAPVLLTLFGTHGCPST